LGTRAASRLGGSGRGIAAPALLLLAVFLANFNAAGVGFRLPSQDAEAIARGNAFVATADNPSAIYYNPAGITQIQGQALEAGIYAISSGVDYTPATGPGAKTDRDLQPVPEFYYVNSLKDIPVSFGFGVYAPYGLAIDWGNDTTFRTIAERGSLLYASFNPVAAWQIVPGLSIAAGPTINYSKAKFERGITPAALSTQDKFSFVGDGADVGFNAGVRWQPMDKLAFGVSYRYLTTINYSGHTDIQSPFLPPALNGTTHTTAEIRFPQFVVAGISYRPTEDWNLEFNIDWTDWDNVNQIVFKGTPAGDQTFLLNYTSSFMYEFGVTRRLPKNYFISVGYFYSENSSPDKNFNPIVPDSSLHLGSIGGGHKGEHWDWALTWHFGYNGGRTVAGSNSSPTPNPFGETADGTYKFFNWAISGSVTWRF
jgi:long-chain fatty acid transport protein